MVQSFVVTSVEIIFYQIQYKGSVAALARHIHRQVLICYIICLKVFNFIQFLQKNLDGYTRVYGGVAVLPVVVPFVSIIWLFYPV